LEYSYYVFGPALIDFDRAVWEVRQYCQKLEYTLETADGREIPMLEKELIMIRQSVPTPHKYILQGGMLEKVFNDLENQARKTLFGRMPSSANATREAFG
jgi:hypothetical protein